MCLNPSVPKIPKPRPVPDREKTGDVEREARRRAKQATGVFGNIFTTRLGDPTHGQAAQSQVTLGAG